MQSKKAIMTSRREFVSNAPGIALVTALTWQARADQARSIHEQSDSRTSNSGSKTQNRSLGWDVFLTPSIPAIAIDLAPGEKERPWPPISSTLISLAPVQFWSDFQVRALSRGRRSLRLCASKHRRSLSIRFGIHVFPARFPASLRSRKR